MQRIFSGSDYTHPEYGRSMSTAVNRDGVAPMLLCDLVHSIFSHIHISPFSV
jgi:hypothetical protein